MRHEPWKGVVLLRARPCDEPGIILGSLFAARESTVSPIVAASLPHRLAGKWSSETFLNQMDGGCLRQYNDSRLQRDFSDDDGHLSFSQFELSC